MPLKKHYIYDSDNNINLNMPPKYKPGGKRFPPKIPPTPRLSSISQAPSSSSSGSALDPEVEDQLEVELCWCIQQLETALNSGKLTERQSLDTTKTLNVLKSTTAPIIKKRQFMRTTFGDYRTKMADDIKRLGKTSTQVKFSASNSNAASTGNKKSIFLKKAAIPRAENSRDVNTTSEDTNENNFRIKPTGDAFNFNFSEPETS